MYYIIKHDIIQGGNEKMKNIVSISNFGAKADGTLQTTNIQAAIDHCFMLGGGDVVVPKGVYLTGGIRLRSNITLYLEKNAVLKGVRDPEAYYGYLHDAVEPLGEHQVTDAPYVGLWTIHGETEYDESDSRYRFKRIPGSRWNNAIIRAIDAENVKIIGEEGSVIDGDNCYDAIGEENYRGPHAICFFGVKNVELRGYTVKNSANWAHNMLFCENIAVKDIKVEAGHDGFDAAVCKNVSITDSEFYTGDDCIAGFGNTNVFVDHCILNSACSAFRFGGTNVLIKHCRAFAPGRYSFRGRLSAEEKKAGVMATSTRNNMLSFFTYYADYSVPIPEEPGNIVIEDCEIYGADRFLHYNFSGNETWQRYRPLRDITFKNIKATNVSMPLTLYGTENDKVELRMKNVFINMREGSTAEELIRACHYSRISIDCMQIDGFNGGCLIKTKCGEDIDIQNVVCELPKELYVVQTTEDFVIQRI